MSSKTHHNAPPSGPWNGNFTYAFDPEGVNPTDLVMTFEGGTLAGEGTDGDGRYTVAGELDAHGAARWQKRYAGRHGAQVAYLGRWNPETRELTGRWRVVNTPTHGRFVLRPGERSGAALVGGDDVARAFLARRREAWQSRCAVDLEALRFDGERAMTEALLRDPDYVTLMKLVQDERDEISGAMTATAPSSARVRLRRPMAPGLFALLDRCVATLGLAAPIELFVQNDGAINACVMVTRDPRIVLEITAGAINQFEPAEMLYVLGHELGHAVLGHLETPRAEGQGTTGMTSLRSFALQRYEEISADRVGLLCCGDVYAALRAEFILATGITNRDALGDVRAFVEHARQAIEAIDSQRIDTGVGFDTHPYAELRALAIDLFARSKTYATLSGKEHPAGLSEAHMEREVARVMRLMNPSVMEAGLKNTDMVEFVALAALAVAGATAGVSAVERRTLRKLLKGHEEIVAKAQALSFEEQQLRLVDLSEVLAISLSLTDRMALVADLTVVARADGRVSRREKGVLDAIASLLGLEVGGVDDTLAPMEAGID